MMAAFRLVAGRQQLRETRLVPLDEKPNRRRRWPRCRADDAYRNHTVELGVANGEAP